ncbi:MAG: hypothetical protein LBT29_03310 [Flavobacteriaceae bacterium]|jgi:hypothetical protein|nr:hypothetical protein [Flavobacteriaceae bacterium]
MKKEILIFGLFFLCCTLNSVAEKIDNAIFDKMVDYTNCKYANAYMKSVGKDQDSIAYFNKIEPQIKNCAFDNYLEYRKLYDLLKNNSWGQTADNLIKTRKEKLKFSEVSSKSNSDIIKYIVALQDGKLKTAIGQNVITVLCEELKGKFPDALSSTGETVIKKPEQGTSTTVINTITLNALIKSLHWYHISIIVFLLIIILLPYLFIFLFIKKLPEPKNLTEKKETGISKVLAKFREFIIEEFLGSGRIQSKFIKSPTDNVNDGKETEKDRDAIESTADTAENKEKNDNPKGEEKGVKAKEKETLKTSPQVQYLMGFARDVNGFNKVVTTQQDDTFFKIFDIADGIAKFDLCVDIQRAKENNIFEYTAICIEVTKGNAAPGKLKYDRDKGKWEVSQPAKIKFA